MQVFHISSIDLFAQVGDVGLHDIRISVEVIVPDVVEDAGFGEHHAGIDHKVAQEGEFGRGELHQLASFPHFMGFVVEFDIGKGEVIADLSEGTAVAAPQDGAKAGDDLFEACLLYTSPSPRDS